MSETWEFITGIERERFLRTAKKSEKAESNLTADRIKLQSFFTIGRKKVVFFIKIHTSIKRTFAKE